mgnify:CR=1 FL=1
MTPGEGWTIDLNCRRRAASLAVLSKRVLGLDAQVVTAFLQDSRLMTSFPEKGAEFYDDYDRACAEFASAFDAKDLTACKAAAVTLYQPKKDCHSRYK